MFIFSLEIFITIAGDLKVIVAIIKAIFNIRFMDMTIISMITIGGDLKGVAPLSSGDSARLVQGDRALGLSV